MYLSSCNSDCIRLNLKRKMSLSLIVNPLNRVCPLLWNLVINTCFVRIDATFIAGIHLTCISCSGYIYSSQTLTFSQGAEAALSLGGPGREKHTRERTKDIFGLQLWPYGNKKWAGYLPSFLQIWLKYAVKFRQLKLEGEIKKTIQGFQRKIKWMLCNNAEHFCNIMSLYWSIFELALFISQIK